MIYWLLHRSYDYLEDHSLGFLHVFEYTTFRSIPPVIVSFLICILLGPAVIRWLRSQKISDLAGFDQAEIDALMASKKGPPTMGGILIISAILITTLLLGRLDTSAFHVQMAIICMLWLGGGGAVGDSWSVAPRRP